MTLEEAENDFYRTQDLWLYESEEENGEEESWTEESATTKGTIRSSL